MGMLQLLTCVCHTCFAVFGFSCGFDAPRRFIAWFRYANYPCDKDIWTQLGEPKWWIFRCLGLVQAYFIQTLLYVLKIVTMERRDDFQLLQVCKLST